MNTYRITARVPWGIERYIVSAPNYMAAAASVEAYGQPNGQPAPIAILWEEIGGEES